MEQRSFRRALNLSAALLLFLICQRSIVTAQLLDALDFARGSLMEFSNGSEEVVPKPPRVSVEVTVVNKNGNTVIFSRQSARPTPRLRSETPGPAATPEQSTASAAIRAGRTAPSNKFFMATNEVERALIHASADPNPAVYSKEKVERMSSLIGQAAEHRSFRYARRLLGQALWLVKQQHAQPGRVKPKRSLGRRVPRFLADLKTQLGARRFDDLMATDGDVSLVFAIDDTGSMAGEIEKAKEIAIDIISQDRSEPVDYILSPFNDPDPTSRAIFRYQTQSAEFVQAIRTLSAHSGGDCEELAFGGMLRALDKEPRSGSPMYVFTDASAKDASDENIRRVKALADTYGLVINFLLTGLCDSEDSVSPYKTLAEATAGQVLVVPETDLGRLSGLAGGALSGTSIVASGSGGSERRRRSGSGVTRHPFHIDDTIHEFSVVVSLAKPTSSGDVNLQAPSGDVITSGKLVLPRVVVFLIKKPQVGAWNLVVSGNVGRYDFRVKSTSSSNIDFDHYFLLKLSGSALEVPVDQPVSGRQIKTLVALSGSDEVVPSSLSLELLGSHGEHISDVTVTSAGTSKVHFVGLFVSPLRAFKLKLKGTTREGQRFERVSKKNLEPQAGSLRMVRATSEYALSVAKEEPETVTFQLYNTGPTETFHVTATDRLGYVLPLTTSAVRVEQWHAQDILVRMRATRAADVGKTDVLFMTATGGTSGQVLSSLALLFVK